MGRTSLVDGQLSAPCDVLHVVWSGDPSGIISQLAGILRLARDGSQLVHGGCFLEGRGAIGDALVDEGLAVRLGVRHGWAPAGLLRVRDSLRRLQPQVVHFHVPAFGPLMVAFAALPKSVFVWTQHDPGVLTKTRRFGLFYRFFRTRFALFVVPSAAIIPALEAYGVPRSQTAVVPHGLTVPLSWRRSPDDRPARVVGTIARLHREKRLDVFVDVIAELHRRGIDVTAFVVGDGPDRERLVRHAQDRGVGDIVRFVGERVDVESWLDRMDIFLVTSLDETAGLAPLEAMARGAPVVAMPSRGGLAEIASRGGRLLPNRDVSTAADAVADLLASTGARAHLRARGAEVASEYALEKTLSRLNALYRRELEAAAASVG